jgi:hypothetical protein
MLDWPAATRTKTCLTSHNSCTQMDYPTIDKFDKKFIERTLSNAHKFVLD